MPILMWTGVALFGANYDYRPEMPEKISNKRLAKSDFSPERAYAHIRKLATHARVPGSAAHRRAQTYIASFMRANGCHPRFQNTFVVREVFADVIAAGNITNIHCRQKASSTRNSKRAILLIAHYDTKPTTYGANDNATNVAITLEILRMRSLLKNRKYPIHFLFTDKEEVGLLGARAFKQSKVLLNNISFIINLEARGTAGPSILFQTTGRSKLKTLLSDSSAGIYSHSLSEAIYAIMPNQTDFSELIRPDIAGFNFAYINDSFAYHNAMDRIATVQERTLYHQARSVLATIDHIEQSEHINQQEGKLSKILIYFPILAGIRIQYGLPTGALLYALSTLIIAYLLMREFRISRMIFLPILYNLVFLFSVCIVAIMLAFALRLLAEVFIPPLSRFSVHEWKYSGLLLGVQNLCVIAFTLFLLSWKLNRRNDRFLYPAILIFWNFLLTLTLIFLPQASYLFQFPLLMSLPLWILIAPKRRNFSYVCTYAIRFVLALALALALLCSLFVPLFLSEILGLMQSAATYRFAYFTVPILVVGLYLQLPILQMLRARVLQYLPLLGIFPAFFLFITAVYFRPFSSTNPIPGSLIHYYDADTQEAFLLACEPDDFFLKSIIEDDETIIGKSQSDRLFPPFRKCPYTGKDLFAVPLKKQAVHAFIDASTKATHKTMQGKKIHLLRIKPPLGTSMVYIFIPKNSGLVAMHLNGMQIFKGRKSGYRLAHKLLARTILNQSYYSIFISAPYPNDIKLELERLKSTHPDAFRPRPMQIRFQSFEPLQKNGPNSRALRKSKMRAESAIYARNDRFPASYFPFVDSKVIGKAITFPLLPE